MESKLPITCEERVCELDADSLVYRLAFMVDLMEGGEQLCAQMVDGTMAKIYDGAQATKVNVYLGTDTNYRLDIAKTFKYKGNRDDKERPQFYDAIRSRFVNIYNAQLIHEREAEDAVGIAAMQHKYYDDYVIGAIDKDMKMIPGYHFNYVKMTLEFIDPVQAARNFYMQLMTGDKSVDNIPGLYHLLLTDEKEEEAKKLKGSRYKKKLEAKLAELSDPVDMYNTVMEYYKEYGEIERHGYERVKEVGQLLWIQRDINHIWEPGEDNQDIIKSVTQEHRDDSNRI